MTYQDQLAKATKEAGDEVDAIVTPFLAATPATQFAALLILLDRYMKIAEPNARRNMAKMANVFCDDSMLTEGK